MEVEVVRIVRFEGKNNFRGYATVRIKDEGSSLIVNGFTIGETKTGKLIGKPPQQKNPKDDKYYDLVQLEGDFMWKVSDAIIDAYKSGFTGAVAKPAEDGDARTAAAMSKTADHTEDKSKRFDPWAEG